MRTALLTRKMDAAAVALAGSFLYVCFAPTFAVQLGTRGAIIVNGGLIALLALVIVWLDRRISFLHPHEKTIVQVVVACLLYYWVAISFGSGVLSRRVVFSDLFELHKPVLHTLSFMLPFIAVRRRAAIRHIERLMLVCFLGVVLMSLLQLFGLGTVAGLYTKESNIRMGRLSAPFGNPYDYAFGLSLFTYVFLFKFLRERGARPLLLAAAGLAMIILAQSRTNVVVVAGSLALSTPIVLALDNHRVLRRLAISAGVRKYLLIAGLTALAGYLVVLSFGDDLGYLIGGIRTLVEQGHQSSLDERLRQLHVVQSTASESLVVALFGNGVSKGVMRLLESGYAFFLFRYGVIGFIVIFLIPLVLAITVLMRAAATVDDPHKHILLGVLVWFASIPVASIGNNFIEQPRLSFLYYFFMGYCIRYYYMVSSPERGDRALGAAATAEQALT